MPRRFLRIFLGSSNGISRPNFERENTSSSDLLEYYQLPDSSRGYRSTNDNGYDQRQVDSRRPSTAPQTTSYERAYAPNERVPQSARPTTTTFPESRQLHARGGSIESNANDNRRVAIVERDPEATPRPEKSNAYSTRYSPSTTTPSSSILARRGVEQSRLAFVHPPDASPSSYSYASFASKSSPSGTFSTSDHKSTNKDEFAGSNSYNDSYGQTHQRTSSDFTTSGSGSSAITSSRHDRHTAGPASPKSPRDVGIVGSRPSPVGMKFYHRQTGSSSGSDYGDGDDAVGTLPVFQTPKVTASDTEQGRSSSIRPNEPHSEMHINLPQYNLLSATSTSTSSPPIHTPGVGETKPIDARVAAPIVTDIPQSIADLWLASAGLSTNGGGPLAEAEEGPRASAKESSSSAKMLGSGVTTSPSLKSNISPDVRSFTSSTSPLSKASNVIHATYDTNLDSTPVSPAPISKQPHVTARKLPRRDESDAKAPPRHIDVNTLANVSSISPPPRPPRSNAHSKSASSSQEPSRAGTPQQMGENVVYVTRSKDDGEPTPVAIRKIDHDHLETPRPLMIPPENGSQYSLVAVSFNEENPPSSASEYSEDLK